MEAFPIGKITKRLSLKAHLAKAQAKSKVNSSSNSRKAPNPNLHFGPISRSLRSTCCDHIPQFDLNLFPDGNSLPDLNEVCLV